MDEPLAKQTNNGISLKDDEQVNILSTDYYVIPNDQPS